MIVYLATNKLNGKGYVGSTVGDLGKRISLHYRQMRNDFKQGRHLSPFKQLLKDADKQVIKWCVLEHVDSIERLYQREAYWTEQLKTNDPQYGYNKLTGNGNMIRANKLEGWHIANTKATNSRLAAFFMQ